MLSPRRLSVLFALTFPALVAACTEESSPTGGGNTGGGGGAPESGPTYHKDVAPILQKSCQSCHRPGDIAPFSLLTYEDAKTVAFLIKEETQARAMPPWGAFETDECQPPHGYQKDARLSDEEIATLAAWQEAGAPEGDPADAPEPVDPPPTGLQDPSLELVPQEPYVTSGDADEFRCFVLDPKITQTTYLNGTFFF